MTLFVAEISSNHNGDLKRGLRSIAAAAVCGCGAVKFQLFRIEQLFSREILQASRAHRLRRRWELPPWFLPELAACAHDHGMQFGCTPFDLEAVDQLLPHVDFLKIASYELCWLPLVTRCAITGRPLMISTGMATAEEIQAAVEAALTAGCADLTLLHCLSAYPAPPERCNLAAIASLRRLAEPLAADVRLRCGWSDHSADPGVAMRAVRHWGAEVVEFHFDLDGQGLEFGAGHCWLPRDIGPVIAGTATSAGGACDGDGHLHPEEGQAEERAWRADPVDGLRPTLAVRRTWCADQPGSRHQGPGVLLIPDGPGWGHLMRCLALAEALRRRHDADPVFLVPEPSRQSALLDRHGLPWRTSMPTDLDAAIVDTAFDPAPVIDRLAAMQAPAVVLDKPRIRGNWLSIVPSLTWTDPGDDPRQVGGPPYLLVREDVCVLRPCQPSGNLTGPVLITFGGTDPAALTERCLAAAAAALPKVPLRVVVGPDFVQRDGRLARIKEQYPLAQVITEAGGFAHLLGEAGLVVTALGVTVGEALCLGVSCAVLGWRPQDESEIAQLEQNGLVASLGQHPGVSDQDLRRRLGAIWGDQPRRLSLARCGWSFCDGQGADRAADAVMAWLNDKETAHPC